MKFQIIMSINLSYDQIHPVGFPNIDNNKNYDLTNSIPESERLGNKFIKLDKNIEIMPLNHKYNLRYGDNYTYNDLEPHIKHIINDPKYNDKRSLSAYGKKSVREKFEEMKLKVPTIKQWNCDPTAEIIIHNLEQKVDILTHENFLLSKKLRDLLDNNKELKLDLSQKILMLKTEQQLNDENKKDKDIDLYKEIGKLKKVNVNIKKENEKFQKTIEDLKNGNLFIQNKYNELVEAYGKLKLQFENISNNINENINDNNKFDAIDENKKPDLNGNEYELNDDQYNKLLNENENLHNKLKKLLCIEIDLEEKNINTDYAMNDNNLDENLIKENLLLKEKITSLNNQLNLVQVQNSIELNTLKQKIKLIESQKMDTTLVSSKIDNEELDKILDETVLLYINNEDDDAKKMIYTIQNSKNIDKKRVSLLMIINSKLKSLISENNFLHGQIIALRRGNNNNNNSYEYLINELKQKDKIIEKYKEKNNKNKDTGKLNNNERFDYLVSKIVDNQKEVLGEKAPKFDCSDSDGHYYNKISSIEQQ